VYHLFQKSTQAIPQINTDFSPRFQNCTRSLAEVRWGSCSDSRGSNGEEPHHGSSQPFYLHGLGLTLVTHETACIPSACIPSIWKFLSFQKKELRIKHNIHMSFGIILKYYSQGLKPLGSTLSPSSHLPAPNPLPTLWKLSPPSLIHRGQSARDGVYILLLFHINTGTKSGSWPSTLRLSGLTIT
jgi:hypothetical protein